MSVCIYTYIAYPGLSWVRYKYVYVLCVYIFTYVYTYICMYVYTHLFCKSRLIMGTM